LEKVEIRDMEEVLEFREFKGKSIIMEKEK